jgi:predicted metalloprotease with PDZ domain
LDELFKKLYYDFAPNHRGYKESDILTLAKEFSDEKIKVIFDELINGVISYEPLLSELLLHVGCEISKTPSKHQQENLFGIRTMQEGGVTKVAAVYPGSPGMEAGISKDDEIIAVNGWKVENNLSDLILDGKDTCILTIFSQRKLKTVVLRTNHKKYFETIKVQQIKNASEMQVEAFKSWTRLS